MLVIEQYFVYKHSLLLRMHAVLKISLKSYLKIYAIALTIILKFEHMDFCYISFAGTGQHAREKLEFRNRLSIALGAAKGDPLQNQ